MKKIVVIGQGFVGFPMSIVLSECLNNNKRKTFNVIGLEANNIKGREIVNKINNNRFEFVSAPESTFTVGKASADSGYSFAPDPTGQGFFIDSAINPTLYLNRGQKYNFVLAAASEPMYIKTAATTGTGDQYTKGVTGNGIQFGTLTFTPTMDADSSLFYQSSVTGGYGGIIKVIT